MTAKGSSHIAAALGVLLLLGAGASPGDRDGGARSVRAPATASSGSAEKKPPAPALSPSSQIIARVNGEPVTLADLERHLQEVHGSADAGQRGGFDLDRLMFRVVNDRLLAQEARALEMEKEEPTRSRVERYRGKLLLRALEKTEIEEKSRPSEEEIREAFDVQYRRVNLRVVTADTREEAERMRDEIRDGADMEAMAKERSVDSYSGRGGSVREVPRRDLRPEIAELAFSLKAGELGGPVRTDTGWSVIRVESFEAADPAELDAARGVLRNLVRLEKSKRLRSELAEKVRSDHPVSVNDELVSRIQPRRLADGRLAPDVENREAIIARVGEDHVVTAGDFADALLRRWTGVRNEEAARAAAPIILQRLLQENLLLAEARKRGYAARPEIVREVRAYESDLLVQRYLKEVVAAGIEVTQEEMQRYYDANKERYAKPPRVRLGQITVATREEAEKVAELLRKGADLSWLARERSIDRFKESGGDRGWTTPQPGADGVGARLLNAKVGDVLDPYGGMDNFVVLKVTAREEQGLYPFREVSGNVRSAVYSEKFRSVLDDFMQKLRGRAEIWIDRELLASLDVGGSVERQRKPGGASGGHAH